MSDMNTLAFVLSLVYIIIYMFLNEKKAETCKTCILTNLCENFFTVTTTGLRPIIQ